jgi:LacI family transcriptional regulator
MNESRTASIVGGGRPVTIVDIARASGVSKSTVSLVLKGSRLVKAETRARVEDAIERSGYIYNRGAANLRKSKSGLVGMVISDLTNPFFAELAVGIENALYQRGFVPILANTNEDRGRQSQVLRSMREHGVAGIVMSPARGTEAWQLTAELPTTIPTVLTMRRVVDSPFSYVGPDNRTGARMATKHLIQLGHRRIAFLGGFSTMTTQLDRIEGWRDALEETGITAEAALVVESMPTRAGGREAVRVAMGSPKRATAFVCYNDIVAIGVTRELALNGIRPGIDVGVVGFDDIAEAEHNAPPLTTVNADTLRLGGFAAESLFGVIHGGRAQTMSFIGTTRLVVRESCGALHASAGKEFV